MTFDSIVAARWQEAVELGARGYAAAARASLSALAAEPATSPAIRSLTFSTRASLLRQAGGHGLARGGDGRACALAVGDRSAGERFADEWMAAAWLDGLIGLAADNLGVGDFALSRQLLDRADDDLHRAQVLPATDWRTVPRSALRLAWVRAEWGLYAGQVDVAQESIDVAAQRAQALRSPRHSMKTQLIGAAVAAASGEGGRAHSEGLAAHATASQLGLLPLHWAAATLLAGVSGNDVYLGEAAELRTKLARLGMSLVPLEPGEHWASIR